MTEYEKKVIAATGCHTCHADKGEPCRWWSPDGNVHTMRKRHYEQLKKEHDAAHRD